MSFHSTVSATAPATIYGDGGFDFSNDWEALFNLPLVDFDLESMQNLPSMSLGTDETQLVPILSEEEELFLQQYVNQNAVDLVGNYSAQIPPPIIAAQSQSNPMMEAFCHPSAANVPQSAADEYDMHEHLFSGLAESSDSGSSSSAISTPDESMAGMGSAFIPSQSAAPVPQQPASPPPFTWHAPPVPTIMQQFRWPKAPPVAKRVITHLPYAIQPAAQAPPLSIAPSLLTNAPTIQYAPERLNVTTVNNSTTSTGGKSPRTSRGSARSGPSRQAARARPVDVVTAASGVPRQRNKRPKNFNGPREIMESLSTEDLTALKRAQGQDRKSEESKCCPFDVCKGKKPLHDPSARDRHIKEVHLGMNQTKCPLCKSWLKRTFNIRRHLDACSRYDGQKPVPKDWKPHVRKIIEDNGWPMPVELLDDEEDLLHAAP